jgi:hypothetical protein
MADNIEEIIATEWGVIVVLKKGFVIDDNIVLPVMQQLIEGSRRTGTKKIMIDASKITRNVSLGKHMEVVELFKEEKFEAKIAFISPQMAVHEQSKFMEIIAGHKGVSFQYFINREKAEKWLVQEDIPGMLE